MRYFFLCIPFLFFLSIIHLNGQNTYDHNKQYSPEQLHSDLEIFTKEIQIIHPSIFEYISQEEFLDLINTTKNKIESNLTELEFQTELRKIIKHIGCGHTAAKPSKEWYSSFRKNQKKIPIEVYIHDEKLFIRYSLAADSVLLKGTEITKIDGIKSAKIISELKSIQQRDGYGNNYVSSQIESLFQIYLIFLYGIKDLHEIEYLDQNNEIKIVNIKTQAPDNSLVKINSTKGIINQISGSKFYYLKEVESTAILDIDRFGSNDYKKYYKEIFEKLEKDQVQNLIIDLRGNGGGYFPNSTRMLRYLLKENNSMEFSRPRKKIKSKDYLSQSTSDKVSAAVFKLIPDRNRQDPNRNHKISYKAFKRNFFDKKIFIITDGGTFSMSSFVASKLKHHTDCTIIGQETGGTEIGTNAIIWYTLTLPKTKVDVVIPRFFIHHDVNPKLKGRGVIPDIQIEYSIDEILKRTDKELEKVKQLIRDN